MTAIGISDITPAQMKRVLETVSTGFERVMAADEATAKARALELQDAITNDGDVATALGNVLILDAEWKQMGIELGLLPPEGPGPAFACGGACIFLGGVVVGYLLH